MSIVTFWSNGKEQTGKTLSIAAIATYMAIEHNYKILIIATGDDDKILNNCFWEEKKKKRNLGLFGPNTNIAMEEGIVGLSKVMKSNRLTAEDIPNYTKTVFKERLEILQGVSGGSMDYDNLRQLYPDIINLANRYYDLVFVDLDNELGEDLANKILGNSNLIVANISQRLTSINRFMELKKEKPILNTNKTVLLIGRFDRHSKYTVKNIARYMKEKNRAITIPYNTLFFEAAEEGKVPDLFLKIRSVDEDDRNGFFLAELKRASENIIYRLQNSAMKI